MTIENPILITVTLPKHVRVKRLRREFKSRTREIFRKLVDDAIRKTPRDKKKEILAAFSRAKFEVHHIVPLSLGGSNAEENLAIVESALHERIHRKINSYPRVRGAKGVEIGIPVYPGRIWYDPPTQRHERQMRPHAHPQQQPQPQPQFGG